MTITKTLTLVDAPEPPVDPRVGTFLTVDVPAEGPLEFGFCNGSRPRSETKPMSVDWGDGNIESVSSLLKLVHGYEKSGTYTIYIDDNLWRFAVSENSDDSPFRTLYAPMVRKLRVNATRMTTINQYAFAGATGLADVDIEESVVSTIGAYAFQGCLALRGFAHASAIFMLPAGVFKGCAGLSGRIDLPAVSSITEDAQWSLPFVGCEALAEIHFAKANEGAVRASSAFKADPRLGAPKATVVFDL